MFAPWNISIILIGILIVCFWLHVYLSISCIQLLNKVSSYWKVECKTLMTIHPPSFPLVSLWCNFERKKGNHPLGINRIFTILLSTSLTPFSSESCFMFLASWIALLNAKNRTLRLSHTDFLFLSFSWYLDYHLVLHFSSVCLIEKFSIIPLSGTVFCLRWLHISCSPYTLLLPWILFAKWTEISLSYFGSWTWSMKRFSHLDLWYPLRDPS